MDSFILVSFLVDKKLAIIFEKELLPSNSHASKNVYQQDNMPLSKILIYIDNPSVKWADNRIYEVEVLFQSSKT
jgi:hypothetical protein